MRASSSSTTSTGEDRARGRAVAGAPGTGLIIDVSPTRLMGLTVDPDQRDRSVLYGLDVTTGEVLFRKPLPRPISGDDRWYGHWVGPVPRAWIWFGGRTASCGPI